MARLVLILALLLAGCAGATSAPTAPELTSGGRCIRVPLIRQTFVRDAATIDFEMKTGRTVRNRLTEACPGLGPTRAFTYRAYRDRLCAGDLVTVLATVGPMKGPSCALGPFGPAEPRTGG